MFTVNKNIEKNRLYIKLTGVIPVSDAKKVKTLIIKETNDLQPNFDVINDISQFISGHNEAGKILQEIMLFLIDKKVNRVARVVGAAENGINSIRKLYAGY